MHKSHLRSGLVTSLFLCLCVVFTPPLAASTLYATSGTYSTLSTLYTADAGTGTLTSIGSVGYVVTGMSYYNGTLYGVTPFSDPSFFGLITIDTTTGAGTPVGSGWGASLPDTTMVDLAIDTAGNAYSWGEGSTDDVYSVNLGTGLVGASPGDAGVSTASHGLAFSPSDVLYLVNTASDGNIYTINTTTGAATFVASNGDSPFAHHGDIDPDTGIYYGVDSNGTGNIVAINLATADVLSTVATGQTDLHTLAFAEAVPIPAALWLFSSGLLGLIGIARRKKA